MKWVYKGGRGPVALGVRDLDVRLLERDRLW